MAVEKNKLLTDDIIVKEALRLLKNNLVMSKLVFRGYEKNFKGKVGKTINIKKPFRTKTASGRVLVKQPMVDETFPLKINRQEHFGIEYTLEDMTLSISEFSDRYLASGMSQIANVIDRSIMLVMKKAWHSVGTPGVRPSKFIDFANAGAKQTTYAIPNDGRRCAIINPFTAAGLSDEVTKLFNPEMVKKAYMAGYKGKVDSYEMFESQNIPLHLVGDHGGTPLIAGTIVNGDTITTDGWDVSTTGLLLAGDVIQFAGVYGVNPQSYETTGLLLDFVVQEDVDSDAGGLATIKVFPDMNDGTATTLNEDGDTISLAATQNITALPADNAVITVTGDANKEYEQTYLFHKEAIALAMVELELPKSATVKARASDPDSGLSLLMVQDFDINEHSEVTRIDAVWGTDLVYGDMAQRLWGAATN
jgi:hypothetical protein